MSVLQYLKLISVRAKGFVYEEIFIMENGKRRLLGVIWMTSTMRRNYELYGGYICFDMMKRGLNKLLWPYTAITMYDETGSLCLACEGFVHGERTDIYVAECRFLGKHAPSRPLTSVQIASADGFFDKEMLMTLGLTNAKFVTDHHHLKDSGLVKKFGKTIHDLLKTQLHRMMDAYSIDEFEQAMGAAKELLMSQPLLDAEAMSRLDQFGEERDTYAIFCIRKIVGNRGRLGNVAAEINHASVLINLNDGVRGINMYTESPLVFAKDLLLRQRSWITKANDRLHAMHLKMQVERARLSSAPNVGTEYAKKGGRDLESGTLREVCEVST